MKRALIAIALIAVIAVAGIYFIQEAQYASARSDARAATRENIRKNFAIERPRKQRRPVPARQSPRPRPVRTRRLRSQRPAPIKPFSQLSQIW